MMEAVETNKIVQFLEGLSNPQDNSNVRKEALQAVKGMDFPTTRVEDWKYTRTTRITNKNYKQLQKEVDVSKYHLSEETHRLVFINGYYDSKQSVVLNDEAVKITSIDELDEDYYTKTLEDVDENVFSLINKGYSTGGVFVTIQKNKKAIYPIHIIHLISGEEVIANTRHFFKAEQGSQAEIICDFYSNDAANAFNNFVMEGHVQENASLKIHKTQAENRDTFNISNEQFIQDKSSNFKINTITTGGLIVRNGLNVIVDGENCHTELNGVCLGKEKQHLDNHTFVDHLYSNCTSSETYKCVMDDQSTGVFNGKVVVRKDAQKIEAYQSNGNILLSDKSTVNSKPELEIYADDVRCSHGSTTGQLDDDAVYYLRTRGISENGAKKLLVAAFVGEVLNKIENKAVRKSVDQLFLTEFGWEF